MMQLLDQDITAWRHPEFPATLGCCIIYKK